MGVSEAIILSAIFRPQVSITVAVGDDSLTCVRANPCAVFARLHPKCRAFGSSEPGWRSWLVRTGGSPTAFFAIDTLG